jgi:hypothetical protein
MAIQTKKCLVATCHASIPSFLLMCKAHWSMVPSRMRVDVQVALREGKEQKCHPTQQYLNAVRKALETVNEKVLIADARSLDRQPRLGAAT